MLETSQGSQAFTSSTIRFTSPLSDVSRNIVFQPGINEGDEVVSKIRFAGGGVNNSINAFANRFAFDGAPITVSSIGTSLSTLCQLPNKSGTIALTSDIPNSLSCTPARRRINTTVSIKAGFNIYPGLNFGTSLSYGVLYCFGTAAELPIGSGTKYFSTQAIGFKIKQMVNLSTDEGIEGSFAIIALQDFNASYMYSYNLTLS